MWWSWQKSKQVKGTRLTVSKGGASASRKVGKHARVSVGMRGVKTSFSFFGFRIRL